MIPLSIVLTGLMNLGLNLIVVFVFILADGVDPTWTWLLLPVVLLPLAMLTTAVSMLLSAALRALPRPAPDLDRVRDDALLRHADPLPDQHPDPEGFRALLMANPIAVILEQARVWIIDPTAPTAAEAAGGVLRLIPATLIFIGVCVAGVARLQPRGAADRRGALARAPLGAG